MTARPAPTVLAAWFGLASAAGAGDEAFTNGPVFEDFGPVADVEVTMKVPAGATFRHSFDVGEAAAPGEANRSLVSAARFINMHARAGVPPERMHLALVVHGRAVFDVAEAGEGEHNASAPLVAALADAGVKIMVCGQSAAYYGVAADRLLPGVDMALSAMTVHALLQQDGYTLNPF